jgi:hypothetical protein
MGWTRVAKGVPSAVALSATLVAGAEMSDRE